MNCIWDEQNHRISNTYHNCFQNAGAACNNIFNNDTLITWFELSLNQFLGAILFCLLAADYHWNF